MAKSLAGMIVDLGVQVVDLSYYRFLGRYAGQTVTGHFVDSNGLRMGIAFTLAINQADGTNASKSLADVVGGIPAISTTSLDGAIGAVVRFSEVTYIDLAVADTADFRTNYATYPIQYSAAHGAVPLGRFNPG